MFPGNQVRARSWRKGPRLCRRRHASAHVLIESGGKKTTQPCVVRLAPVETLDQADVIAMEASPVGLYV